MSRSRNIKPSFFTNDALAECEPLARILFVGLWTIADRQGRLHDRPKKIKAEVLPYDDCNPDLLLNQLVQNGFIIRYQNNAIDYIQIVNFQKHQNPHVKESASDIPAPDKHQTSPVQNVPLTESPIPLPESIPKPTKPETASVPDEDFDNLRAAYPKCNGAPKPAKKALAKALKEERLDVIIAGARRYAAHTEKSATEIQFRKHLSTWLNESGWEAEYYSKNDPPPPTTKDPEKAKLQGWMQRDINNTTKFLSLSKQLGQAEAMEQLRSEWA